MRRKEFWELFFVNITCFGKTINGFVTLNVHVAVVHDIQKFVLINDLLGDQIDGDADILVILWIIKRCPQIVIFNVHSHETGS